MKKGPLPPPRQTRQGGVHREDLSQMMLYAWILMVIFVTVALSLIEQWQNITAHLR